MRRPAERSLKMNKKHFVIRILVMLILVAMLFPSFLERSRNENMNKDVSFALNYNSASNALSTEEFEKCLDENKKIGATTLAIGEESLNTLFSSGFIVYTNYSDLCVKYDSVSEEIVKLLGEDNKLRKDSFILITKRPEWKAYLDKWITAKYTENEYTKKVTQDGTYAYVLYEGGTDGKRVAVGFNEEKIETAYNNGFEIMLSMMFGGFSNTEYIERIEEIIDKYDVKFINLKENSSYDEKSPNAEKNYKTMCDLIQRKKLYLVVTENQDQLSNQKPIGYFKLIDAAEGRVLRSYETVDFGAENPIEARYHQIINSVTDRNIRMVVVNQLTSGIGTYEDKSDRTNEATKLAINKLRSIGYNTESYNTQYDYSVNRRFNSAVALVLMIIMAVTMAELLFSNRMKKLELMGALAIITGAGFSLVAPEGIICLYPTLFAALAPCFAITVMLTYVKSVHNKINTSMLLVTTALVSAGTLALLGMVQATLLSGLDYYINSLIFRGIKISLILPIVYSMVALAIMLIDKKDNYLRKTIKLLNMQIKVYWLILAAAAAAVAAIYLIRSGNVSSISPIESFMRNSIAELMTARPRTKEFLIGWPCLSLFVYYVKNTDSKLFKWCFGVGSSILFASVINSFCHVFTSAWTIYQRLFNGIIIGAIVAAIALIVNNIAIRLVKIINKKYY